MNTIRIKRSNTPGQKPQTLTLGELAVNIHDSKLFVGGNSTVNELNLNTPSCFVVDSKPLGKHGGTTREAKWNVRTVTSITHDDYGICKLVNDDFVLQKGAYLVSINAAVYKVNRHKLRIVNETTGVTVLEGNSDDSERGGNGYLTGILTSNGTDLFEIQQYTENKKERYGFGKASNVGISEIYLTMSVVRIGN